MGGTEPANPSGSSWILLCLGHRLLLFSRVTGIRLMMLVVMVVLFGGTYPDEQRCLESGRTMKDERCTKRLLDTLHEASSFLSVLCELWERYEKTLYH